MTPRRALVFLGIAVGIQTAHYAEHVVQLYQYAVLGNPNALGILGELAGKEPVHFIYNVSFFALLVGAALSPWPGQVDPFYRQLFTLGFMVQAYHVIEHSVKLGQWVVAGTPAFGSEPGILGAFVPEIPLHFFFNSAALFLIAAPFVKYRLWRPIFHARRKDVAAA